MRKLIVLAVLAWAGLAACSTTNTDITVNCASSGHLTGVSAEYAERPGEAWWVYQQGYNTVTAPPSRKIRLEAMANRQLKLTISCLERPSQDVPSGQFTHYTEFFTPKQGMVIDCTTPWKEKELVPCTLQ